MAFRLNGIEISGLTFKMDKVQFVDPDKDTLDNYFSLIVGNNGTGKSLLLRGIVDALREGNKSKYDYLPVFPFFGKTGKPSKVIAVTSSLTDKFPLNGNLLGISTYNYKEQRYNYLGTRGRFGGSSSYMMRRAIDILIENYSNKDIARCLRYVFNYLEYQPLIEITYNYSLRESVGSNRFINKENITVVDIVNQIESNKEYATDREKDSIDRFIKQYENKFEDICDFLNSNNLKKDFKLVIDFSHSNVEKINEDSSIYESNLKTYEILNLLRKIKMIRNFDIKVFKNDSGDSLKFNDTSSGEANILITMISLIPLLEDNCCVVIDEPEISLHPSWQYRYIELLMKVFESFKGCHIIIASHSHFLVSDLPLEGSSVITLKREQGMVKATLLPNSTYGWSAEDILLNIFDMPTSRNYYLSNIVSEALELISNGKKNTETFKDIRGKLAKFEPNMKEYDPLKLVINTIINIDR